MIKLKKNRKTKIALGVVAALVIVAAGLALWSFYGKSMLKKIPGLTFGETLDYTLKANEAAVITVGTVKAGQRTFTVYGANSQVLPAELHRYEIGSVTKTFTAALIGKAVQEGRINLNEPIDAYLPLPEENNYPTIADLLTHTSDYSNYYFDWPMAANFFAGKNSFYGVTKESVNKKLSSLTVSGQPHGYKYSNFGYAVLGLILEEVYDGEYAVLMGDYISKELKLQNTQIADQPGDLAGYWDWNRQDAYLPAGAIVSDIEDMLAYARMQLDDDGRFRWGHEPLKKIDAASADHEMLNIRLDSIGMGWIIDEENDIIWHNGATGHFNSYLGFDPDSGTAVVILSNLAPSDRIPATVLGIKLMEELRDNQ